VVPPAPDGGRLMRHVYRTLYRLGVTKDYFDISKMPK
jgi:hypothetical protein